MAGRRGLLGGVPDAYATVGQDVADAASTYIGAAGAADARERTARQDARAESAQQFQQGLALRTEERADRTEARTADQQDFERGLKTNQDVREGKKFDMSAQLHPAAMQAATAQASSATTHADMVKVQLNDAVRQSDRNLAAGKAMEKLLAEGATMKPEDFSLGMFNAALLSGNFEHARQAMNDHRQVTEPTRIGEDTRQMLSEGIPLFIKASKTQEIPDILALQEVLAKYPRAIAHKWNDAVPKMLETAMAKQLPYEAQEALRNYVGQRRENPNLPARQVWDSTVGLKPEVLSFFNANEKYIPYEVRSERKVEEAGAEARAKAEGTLPSDITKATVTSALHGDQRQREIAQTATEARATQAAHTTQAGGEERKNIAARGVEAQKLEGMKEKFRKEADGARTHGDLVSGLTNSRKELDRLLSVQGSATFMAMEKGQQQEHSDEVAAARIRVREWEAALQRNAKGATAPPAAGATGSEAGGSETAPTPAPKGIRTDVVQQTRAQLGQVKSLTYEQLQEALRRNLESNRISKEEHDHLLKTEGNRLKPKGK